jgi:predicted HicB family RNase H-like nuclease
MLPPKTLNSEEKRIYKAAAEALRRGTTVAAFTDAFFGPEGMLRRLWRTKADREALVKSELYQWLQQQAAHLRRQEAQAFTKEVESLSGRLTVVVAKSLHGALRDEAVKEGVSLSELIRLKLSLPYSESISVLSAKARKKSEFPPGWDDERVRRVLEHYESQTEDEAVAEHEAALEGETPAVGDKPISRRRVAKPRLNR